VAPHQESLHGSVNGYMNK